MKTLKKFKIYIPIYDHYIHIFIVDEISKEDGMAYVCETEEKVVYATFQRDKLYPWLLAHEVVHLVSIIFKFKGVKLDANNDESQAYLTEFIFHKTWLEFEKFKEKKKHE